MTDKITVPLLQKMQREGRKIVGVAEILWREAGHDPARERQHLRVLRRAHLGQQALDRFPRHARIVCVARRGSNGASRCGAYGGRLLPS